MPHFGAMPTTTSVSPVRHVSVEIGSELASLVFFFETPPGQLAKNARCPFRDPPPCWWLLETPPRGGMVGRVLPYWRLLGHPTAAGCARPVVLGYRFWFWVFSWAGGVCFAAFLARVASRCCACSLASNLRWQRWHMASVCSGILQMGLQVQIWAVVSLTIPRNHRALVWCFSMQRRVLGLGW